jgi:hypothetical protein
MRKDILVGIVVGLLATGLGFYLYVEFVLNGSFQESLVIINNKNLYGQILSIAAIPNLLVFFIFIKKKQDYKARGVLIATFLVAFLILVSQFL